MEEDYLPPLFSESLPPIVKDNSLLDLDVDEFKKEYANLPDNYKFELSLDYDSFNPNVQGLSDVFGIKIESRTITKKRAKKVVGISTDLDSSFPVSLGGLRFFPNVRSISWEDSMVRDLDEIKYLNNIEEIYFELCNLGLEESTEELNGLANMKRINEINIITCNLKDIEFLSGCQNLTPQSYIGLENNQIVDITPMSHIRKLDTIDLTNNQIKDIEPLSGLKSIKELSLFGNPIKDIRPLSSLRQGIKMLWLGRAQIKDIHPLSDLTELTFLNLSDNQITDLAPLVNLKKLKTLWIDNNKIQDISILFDLPALEDLNVEGNPIKNSQIRKFKEKAKKEKFSFKY
ncbi:MAG: leucine-rich repeat domain-containing protein [Lachnoclostridium sp.]|nr:leucine-rich repeat domain-containing protein [Lachnoclostridium sp.]